MTSFGMFIKHRNQQLFMPLLRRYNNSSAPDFIPSTEESVCKVCGSLKGEKCLRSLHRYEREGREDGSLFVSRSYVDDEDEEARQKGREIGYAVLQVMDDFLAEAIDHHYMVEAWYMDLRTFQRLKAEARYYQRMEPREWTDCIYGSAVQQVSVDGIRVISPPHFPFVDTKMNFKVSYALIEEGY